MSGPESYCHRCGGPNVIWYAPSPLWNEVMRDGDINGPWKWDEIICPTCFAVLCIDAGVATTFRMAARDVKVLLTSVTPSGRVWDAATDLWLDDPDQLSLTSPCRVFWGSHGCDLPRDHPGPCLCTSCWDPEDMDGYVGAWPYYGPETQFYGEDALAKWGLDRLIGRSGTPCS